MTAQTLISILPPEKGEEKLIADWQDTDDIIKEVLAAHTVFSGDYDTICGKFAGPGAERKLFNFCRKNLDYDVEKKVQTTRSPVVLLKMGRCDCKGYAGFIAGVLDGLNRSGQGQYDWRYRFANYEGPEDAPGHVFVVTIDDKGKETWIDPVLHDFNQRDPMPTDWVDKARPMTLVRMAGTHGPAPPHAPVPSTLSMSEQPPKGAGHLAGALSAYSSYSNKMGTTFPGTLTEEPVPPPLDLGIAGPVPAGTVNGYGKATWIPPGYPTAVQPYLYQGQIILRPLRMVTEVNVQQAIPYIMAALQVAINQYSQTPYSIIYTSKNYPDAASRIENQTLATQSRWAAMGAGWFDWTKVPPQPSGLDTVLDAASTYIPAVVSAGINYLVPGLGTLMTAALNAATSNATGMANFARVASSTQKILAPSSPATTATTATTTIPPIANVTTTSGTSMLDTITEFAEANPIPTIAIAAGLAYLLYEIFSD